MEILVDIAYHACWYSFWRHLKNNDNGANYEFVCAKLTKHVRGWNSSFSYNSNGRNVRVEGRKRYIQHLHLTFPFFSYKHNLGWYPIGFGEKGYCKRSHDLLTLPLFGKLYPENLFCMMVGGGGCYKHR